MTRIKAPHDGAHKIEPYKGMDTKLLNAHHRMSMGMSPEPAVPDDVPHPDKPLGKQPHRQTHLSDDKGNRHAGHEGRELDKGPGY